jgi:hypothetical protein
MLVPAPQSHSVEPSEPDAGPALARSLELRGPGHPQRAALEAFIRSIYARRYGAQVRDFAPMLVALRDHNAIVAAAGYRDAADTRLYLERYLSEPVEAALARVAHHRVARERIVEVGHLASERGGEGLRLIRLIAPHLANLGFEWVVCTVTRELRPALERLDTRPLTLHAAEPSVLGKEAASWGKYYEHAPVVVAVELHGALRRHAERRSRGRGRP